MSPSGKKSGCGEGYRRAHVGRSKLEMRQKEEKPRVGLAMLVAVRAVRAVERPSATPSRAESALNLGMDLDLDLDLEADHLQFFGPSLMIHSSSYCSRDLPCN